MEQALGRESASASRSDSTSWLLGIYLNTIRPFLGPEVVLGSSLSNNRQGDLFFERALASVTDELRGTVEQLALLCRMRRRLQLQARLYGLLHGWLKVHVPLSVVLLVFTVLHVVSALYF